LSAIRNAGGVGIVGCFLLCALNREPTANCRSTCGWSTTECIDCDIDKTPEEACFAVCAANGDSATNCTAICTDS
jgi:hypothetical protein